MHRLSDHFRIGHRGWVQRRPTPRDIQRQSRKIDDASVATVAAHVVRRAHKNAIYRARFDAQRAEHALGVVNRVPSDLEPFAAFDTLFADVNTIDWAGLGTLIAGDASRQIE